MQGVWPFLAGVALMLAHVGCAARRQSSTASAAPPRTAARTEGDRVLVVMNAASNESVEIARHYARARRVPPENLVRIDTAVEEEIFPSLYYSEIEKRVRAHLATCPNRDVIDFIVVTKGVPIRITEGGYSVDGHLATMDLPDLAAPYGKPGDPGFQDQLEAARNPYFHKHKPFRRKEYGFYLVTRLDGYDKADAMRLVDNSLAARRERGPFFFDRQPNKAKAGGGYAQVQRTLIGAGKLM